MIEVLEQPIAQVPESDFEPFLLVLEQHPRCVRDKHLATVCGGADARTSVDCEARVPAVCRRCLTGVDAHPDLDMRAVRPVTACKSTLSLDRGQHGLVHTREGDEESVALSIDLMAAVVRKSLTEKFVVRRQQVRVRASRLPEKPSGPLDVGEEEGDCTARQVDHVRLQE